MNNLINEADKKLKVFCPSCAVLVCDLIDNLIDQERTILRESLKKQCYKRNPPLHLFNCENCKDIDELLGEK